jgi:hypothetical protein
MSKFLKTLLQLIIIGALLVMTKRKAKWLFWPLFVFINWAISPWIIIGILVFIQVFIFDFILGVSIEILEYEWFVLPIWGLTYLFLIPALYKTINSIEMEVDGQVTPISTLSQIIGYTWGLAFNIFLLYRLDFFDWVFWKG